MPSLHTVSVAMFTVRLSVGTLRNRTVEGRRRQNLIVWPAWQLDSSAYLRNFRFTTAALLPFNLVPRVFSLSNMAAAGEKTLAHSTNHVTDLSTESGNLFKIAAKLKSERIWVQGLETWWKTNKMAAEANSKKLKIWMNALTSHRNTVEWYSDLIFCSMTWV